MYAQRSIPNHMKT